MLLIAATKKTGIYSATIAIFWGSTSRRYRLWRTKVRNSSLGMHSLPRHTVPFSTVNSSTPSIVLSLVHQHFQWIWLVQLSLTRDTRLEGRIERRGGRWKVARRLGFHSPMSTCFSWVTKDTKHSDYGRHVGVEHTLTGRHSFVSFVLVTISATDSHHAHYASQHQIELHQIYPSNSDSDETMETDSSCS